VKVQKTADRCHFHTRIFSWDSCLKIKQLDAGLIKGVHMNKTETITLPIGHVVEVEVTPLLDDVIEAARKMRARGSTKIDAVRSIYPEIAELPRESIWYAIIHGVNLSSRAP
jgi:hypothetical protein